MHESRKYIFSVIMRAMSRKKATVYLEPELLRTAKVWAARTGKKDYEVIEEALRSYLGQSLCENVWSKSNLSEKRALELAYSELHKARK